MVLDSGLHRNDAHLSAIAPKKLGAPQGPQGDARPYPVAQKVHFKPVDTPINLPPAQQCGFELSPPVVSLAS